MIAAPTTEIRRCAVVIVVRRMFGETMSGGSWARQGAGRRRTSARRGAELADFFVKLDVIVPSAFSVLRPAGNHPNFAVAESFIKADGVQTDPGIELDQRATVLESYVLQRLHQQLPNPHPPRRTRDEQLLQLGAMLRIRALRQGKLAGA